MDVMIIIGTSRECCGVGTVTIHSESGDFAEVNYDLLIGIGAIIALVGVKITPAGNILLEGEQ